MPTTPTPDPDIAAILDLLRPVGELTGTQLTDRDLDDAVDADVYETDTGWAFECFRCRTTRRVMVDSFADAEDPADRAHTAVTEFGRTHYREQHAD